MKKLFIPICLLILIAPALVFGAAADQKWLKVPSSGQDSPQTVRQCLLFDNATAGGTSIPFYIGDKLGNFTFILDIISGSGTVDVDYEISPDNATWFSPSTNSIFTGKTADFADEATIIATPWIRITTDVTPTSLIYDIWGFAN